MIRTRAPILAAVAAMIMMPSAAHAELIGLAVFREEMGGIGPAPPGPERWIYRVYAEFSNTTDSVLGWSSGTSGLGGIWNVTAANNPGSGFTNIPDGITGNTAPTFSGLGTDWDTYMTIGVLYGHQSPGGIDQTNVLPNTNLFIANGSTAWAGNSMGVVLNLSNLTQGLASYRVNGNDTDRRVLLMQLVVNEGEHVHGRIRISWRELNGNVVGTDNLLFATVPAPSVFSFGLVLSICQCRRRMLA